jgi:UDP-glucose 4-epimerase
MKVLITGNLGFVGQETTRYFKSQGLEPIGFDLMSGNDIRNYAYLRNFCINNNVDRILHLAAVARFSEADENPKLAFETNVMGTKNVALVSGELSIPVVYASTGSVYMPITQTPPITENFKANGNSVYACTKYLGELYIKELASTYIILRYSHLYGKDKRYHGLIGGFLDRMERALSPTLYGGNQSNDFMYIKDVARANYVAITTSPDNWRQTYNIGTGLELTAKKAGEIIIKMNNLHSDKPFKGKVEVKKGRTVDPERFVFDTTKAETMLGFKYEYDFENGLNDMFELIEAEKHPPEGYISKYFTGTGIYNGTNGSGIENINK